MCCGRCAVLEVHTVQSTGVRDERRVGQFAIGSQTRLREAHGAELSLGNLHQKYINIRYENT